MTFTHSLNTHTHMRACSHTARPHPNTPQHSQPPSLWQQHATTQPCLYNCRISQWVSHASHPICAAKGGGLSLSRKGESVSNQQAQARWITSLHTLPVFAACSAEVQAMPRHSRSRSDTPAHTPTGTTNIDTRLYNRACTAWCCRQVCRCPNVLTHHELMRQAGVLWFAR